MVDEWIRPFDRYIGVPGEEDESVIELNFTLEEEDGSNTYIEPDTVTIQEEVFNKQYTLERYDEIDIIVGATQGDDWEATLNFDGEQISVITFNQASGYTIEKLLGIKIIEITYQGKTYTNFKYSN